MTDTSNISSGGHTPNLVPDGVEYAAGTAFAEAMGLDENEKPFARLTFPNGAPDGLRFSDIWDRTPLVLMRADRHADLLAALEAVLAQKRTDDRSIVYTLELIAQIDAALIKGRAGV